jgi:hypothetical protein
MESTKMSALPVFGKSLLANTSAIAFWYLSMISPVSSANPYGRLTVMKTEETKFSRVSEEVFSSKLSCTADFKGCTRSGKLVVGFVLRVGEDIIWLPRRIRPPRKGLRQGAGDQRKQQSEHHGLDTIHRAKGCGK